MKIRCCVTYGPQESTTIDKKQLFWKYLEDEYLDAKKEGAGYILQFNGNVWAGSGVIHGDVRQQNRNGNLFQQFITRNNLIVINSLSICQGTVTRERILR